MELIQAPLTGEQLGFQPATRNTFSTLWQKTVLTTNTTTGQVSPEVHSFVELASGLNYRDAGDQWQPSREEFFPVPGGGFAAVLGPNKLRIKTDLSEAGAIQLETEDGLVLASAPIALGYFSPVSGESIILARVQKSAPEQTAPNALLFRDAFDAIHASVQVIYRKGSIHADVTLHEAPPDPATFGLTEARLEIYCEYPAETPEPQKRVMTIKSELDPAKRAAMAEPDFEDEFLQFGQHTLIGSGRAFSVDGQADAADAVPVGKRWIREATRAVLVEAVEWQALKPLLEGLPQAANLKPNPDVQVAQADRTAKTTASRAVPERRANIVGVRVAQRPSPKHGVVIDPTILTSTQNNYTFTNGSTYRVTASFGVGPGAAVFQNNCTVKYDNNAYMFFWGTVSFPASGTRPVFTAWNDDLYGEDLSSGVGAPTYMAYPAILIYFPSSSTTIQNVRVRWAKRCIEYSSTVSHQVSDKTILEQSDSGVRNNYLVTITLSGVTRCGLLSDGGGAGYAYITGGMSQDCGVKNSSMLPGHQSEPAIAVRQRNGQTQIVIVSMINPGSVNSLLMSISNDSGATWANTVIANGVFGNPPMVAAQSDAACAFDSFGNLFVAYNTLTGAALYVSSDSGASFQTVPGFNGSDHNYFGPPRVATGPGGSFPQSVWVCYATQNGVVAKGTGINYMGVGNISGMWTTSSPAMRTNNTICLAQDNAGYPFTDIAVGPNGKVVVVFQHADDIFHNPPRRYYTAINTAGLASTQFVAGGCFEINLGWEEIEAMPSFTVNPNATLSWNLAQDKIYLAYTGRACTPASDQPCNDNTDIYVRSSINNGTTWSLPVQVNDDSGTRSQFHPRIAVDQSSGQVAVSWHDCRNDAANSRAQFFAAVSRDGFSTPKPRNFQLNPGQSDATGISFGYLDYTGLAYFKGRLFPVWADNSNSTNDNPDGGLNPIKFDLYTCNVAY